MLDTLQEGGNPLKCESAMVALGKCLSLRLRPIDPGIMGAERGKDYQSVSTRGLFPAGEGAGYAGGIVSAAVDGLKCGRAVVDDLLGRSSLLDPAENQSFMN